MGGFNIYASKATSDNIPTLHAAGLYVPHTDSTADMNAIESGLLHFGRNDKNYCMSYRVYFHVLMIKSILCRSYHQKIIRNGDIGAAV
jgi:hypothetical protein